MYLPRNLVSQLYTHLVKTTHPLSPPVLLLVSLDPDALCACRILTALLKRDYIPHKVQPVAGYSELAKAGQSLVKPLTRQHGGDGGVVICLGLGGLVDLDEVLGLDGGEDEGVEMADHGVEVWVVDARRPWNLQNVFGSGSTLNEASVSDNALKRRRGVDQGKLQSTYMPGKGGIIVFDDGDIDQDLSAEKGAFCALQDMPDLGEEQDDDDDASDSDGEEDASDDETGQTRKRKSAPDAEDDEMSDSEDEDGRPRQRRRSNSGSSIPASRERTPRRERLEISNHPTTSQLQSPSGAQASSPPPPPSQPSSRTLRRRLLRLRRKHESVLQAYYALGTSYSEPVSSMLYTLAEELGREDNDLLWLAIVGVSSSELYAYTHLSDSSSSRSRSDWSSNRHERIRQVMRDEVRRLNPTPAGEILRERELNESGGVIPTHARSPTDTSIRLSPEPRFLLIRHWSLYDSMLHSPYLSCRLHIWSEPGRKRLDRLLTKMGVSLDEARKGYTHMDMDLKRGLRQRLLKFAPMYGLEGLVPPKDSDRNGQEGWGFVRCWGWKACLSAIDVAVIVGAILEVGTAPLVELTSTTAKDSHRTIVGSYSSRIRALPTPDSSPLHGEAVAIADPDWTTNRFFAAYDALAPSASSLSLLLAHVPTAKHLHRAILRTGSQLVSKGNIRHLRAFRMGVVKEGPDVPLFVHPGALVKLAGWVAEAVGVLEAEKGAKERGALVLGALDDERGVYVVVGLGGGGGVGGRMQSKAELKAREVRKAAKAVEKERKLAEKVRKKLERRRLRRERNEANGIFHDEDDDDAAGHESDDTESGSDSSNDSDSDSEDEEMVEKRKRRGYGLNRFGAAFQEVVEETAARVRIDSFEHCVVEVKKEDFSGFLEALSLKSVVG